MRKSSYTSALWGTAIFALLCLLLAPSLAQTQPAASRLVLKDGSYQPVLKYEVKGDRVRYLSAERNEWEEVPKSLVDWPATEKFEKDRASGAVSPEAAALDKELETERKADEAKSPQVAPGLRLPDDGGVFLLDTFQNQPQLVEIQQSGGEVNRNTKGNIFRAAINPVASSKQTVELEGQHAKIQAHVAQPTVFVNVEQDSSISPDQPQKTASAEKPSDPLRFRIVRMQVKSDKRIVGAIKIAIYGKVSQQENLIPSHAELIPGSGWVKVVPNSPLSPGEYAVAEMLGDEGMNLYVWDFGVNPSAPANATAWKPEPTKSPANSEKPPELEKRN
jgi:hypothetical protein